MERQDICRSNVVSESLLNSLSNKPTFGQICRRIAEKISLIERLCFSAMRRQIWPKVGLLERVFSRLSKTTFDLQISCLSTILYSKTSDPSLLIRANLLGNFLIIAHCRGSKVTFICIEIPSMKYFVFEIDDYWEIKLIFKNLNLIFHSKIIQDYCFTPAPFYYVHFDSDSAAV